MKVFVEGDRVKLVGRIADLPDPNGVGRFNLPSTEYGKTFIVGRVSSVATHCKLLNLDGSPSHNGYWYCFSWIKPENPIWLEQKEK